MNGISALGRKMIYLAVLIAMLVPLYMLGQPAGGGADVGGRLSVMRHDFNIAESDLGEISPASQTMKLASFGLRGVAATLLWQKMHEYRVTHEWDRMKAAVNNIALLQPHSEKVWEFHSHNLTYNVSPEFDDYRQRYQMVREGTEFLQRGVRQNRNATRLIWYTGWFYGSKMGTADERTQFRKLFADDDVLHEALLKEGIDVDDLEARGPLGKPDNWLVGRLWLNKGYDLVGRGVKIRRQTPINFFVTGPKWRIKHAEVIEQEGILDDRAISRWQLASQDWEDFGNRSVPTTQPFTIKLGQLDELRERRAQRLADFRELTGAAYTRARQELFDMLPSETIDLLNTPVADRTKEESRIIPLIEQSLVPNLADVSKNSDPSVSLRAIGLLREIADLDARENKTNGMRTQINFPYWEILAQAEQEERTVTARRLIYDAEKANDLTDLDEAILLYDKAFKIWADIFDDYPILTVDDTADDLYDSIRRYMVANDSQEFPEDFPLKSFVVMMSQSGSLGAPTYLQVRESMAADADRRKEELRQEEQQREKEAAKAEKAEAEKAEVANSVEAASKDEPAAKSAEDADDDADDDEDADEDAPAKAADAVVEPDAADSTEPETETSDKGE